MSAFGGRKKGEKRRHEERKVGRVGVRGSQEVAGGGRLWRVSSRAALTWARKSMGPPTRTQTRSVEPRTRPICLIIRSRTRECSASSPIDRIGRTPLFPFFILATEEDDSKDGVEIYLVASSFGDGDVGVRGGISMSKRGREKFCVP